MPTCIYAQIKNPALLRALVGPEPGKVMTGTRLAHTVNVTQPFISHLLTGRRRRLSAKIAASIATTLGVKMGVLFEPAPSTAMHRKTNRERVA